MYYPDLSVYRDGDDGELANVYPTIRNIGWLWSGHDYTTGEVDPAVIKKLRKLLFLDVVNAELMKDGAFLSDEAINIHLMHMRGSPHKCPLCNQEVRLEPDRHSGYDGETAMILGKNEVCIPSLKSDEFYAFPTLLYHFITEHQYCPPSEFVDAVVTFDLTKPYDIDKEQEELPCIEMPANEVNDFCPKR